MIRFASLWPAALWPAVVFLALTLIAAPLEGSGGGAASAAAAEKLRPAGLPAEAGPWLKGQWLEGPLLDLSQVATRLQTVGVRPTRASLLSGSKRLADAAAAGQLRLSPGGRVQVDVALRGEGPAGAALAALGVVVERQRPNLGRVQYQAPPTALIALTRLPGVSAVRLPSYARVASGSVLSEGDAALRTDLVRAEQGLSGAGVRIGVISDGIRGLSQARARGDAPALFDQRAFAAEGLNAGAEGTAMIEIVHDLAPGAAIAFANAATDLDMMEAVNYLAERVDIVVDDLAFFQPGDQQSDVSRNTAAALGRADWRLRAYVTSVGNWANRHYAAPFQAGPAGGTLGLPFGGRVHRFTAVEGTSDARSRRSLPYNEIQLGRGDSTLILLFWNDPWGASVNDYDLYLLNAGNVVVAESTAVQGMSNNEPRERLFYSNSGAAGTFRVVVHNFEDRAAPRTLELYVFDTPLLPGAETALNFNTIASSVLAQSDAGGGVISVAAVDQRDPGLDTIEVYSSRGPTRNGVIKPDLTAVDGVRVTGSGNFVTPFFGTSAAAPHVAAVAALLLEARPSLLAADGGNAEAERALLRSLLVDTAIDLGEPGLDTTFGAGRLDTVLALERALTNIVSVESEADNGPGSLRAAIATLNELALNEAAAAGGGNAILFSAAFEIRLESPLPALSADGVTLEGAGAIVDGAGLARAGEADGLRVSGGGLQISDLTLRGFAGAGLHLDGTAGATVRRLRVTGNGVGLLVDNGASAVRVGGGGETGVVAGGNVREGVRIAGAGTSDVQIQDSFIGVSESGVAEGNGGHGALIMAGAVGSVIGAGLAEAVVLSAAQGAELVHTFQGTVTLNGLPAPSGTTVEVFLDGASMGVTTVGLVEVNGRAGFVLTVAGPGETVTFEVDGVVVEERFAFEAGALTTVALAVSVEAAAVERPTLAGGNVIAFNGGNGIRVEGAASLGNTLRGNAIHSNGALAIDLVAPDDPASGLTPNDSGDGDSGPNGLLNRPSIDSVAFAGGLATVEGSAPSGATVDLYAVVDVAAAPGVEADAAGAGGAIRFLGSAVATANRFRITEVVVEGATVLSALASDAEGNSSEFALNLAIGPGPTLSGVSPASGASGGGTLVTLRGEAFVGGAGLRVLFGGVEATVVSAIPSQVVVRAPAGPAGPVVVAVVNPDGRSAALADAFRYVPVRLVTLQPGWNNVRWAGAPTPVPAAINALAGLVDRVFAWIAEEKRYEVFTVGAPGPVNTLTTLEPEQTLWLFLGGSQAVVWEQPLPPSPTLEPPSPALEAEAVGVGVEPAAAAAVAGGAPVEGGPEGGRVVGEAQVQQLVGDHGVEDGRRGHDESPVEAERAAR